MTLVRSSLTRPAAITSWWAAIVILIISLFSSVSDARADCYEECMVACRTDGDSNRVCHNYCRRKCY